MEKFPNFDLNGKTALVTGAARGLGRAISLALANAGADIALGFRDIKAGGDLVRDIEKLGAKGFAAANGHVEARSDLDSNRAGGRRFRPSRHSGQQCWNRARQPGGECHRKRFRCDDCDQFERHVLCQPGCRPNHDPPEIWPHHQYEFAGWIRGASDRECLLHDQSWYRAPDEMPCSRVGQVQHHRQRRCANIHSHARNQRVSRRTENRADTIERIAALHRIGEPMEVAGAVVFLASDAASLITGHTMLIDGGWTAR